MPKPKNDYRRLQKELLNALVNGQTTVSQALDKTKIERFRLSKWLDGTAFRQKIRPLRKRLRLLRNLEAELNSCVTEWKRSQAIAITEPKAIPPETIGRVVTTKSGGHRSKPKQTTKNANSNESGQQVSDEEIKENVAAMMAERKEMTEKALP